VTRRQDDGDAPEGRQVLLPRKAAEHPGASLESKGKGVHPMPGGAWVQLHQRSSADQSAEGSAHFWRGSATVCLLIGHSPAQGSPTFWTVGGGSTHVIPACNVLPPAQSLLEPHSTSSTKSRQPLDPSSHTNLCFCRLPALAPSPQVG
jgi:hypothetical protein